MNPNVHTQALKVLHGNMKAEDKQKINNWIEIEKSPRKEMEQWNLITIWDFDCLGNPNYYYHYWLKFI